MFTSKLLYSVDIRKSRERKTIMKNGYSTEILAQNIIILCRRENISVNGMLKRCSLNRSIVDNLRKGYFPTVDKVAVIAQYFKVTIEYLLRKNE